jgi:copper transport protein
MRSAVRPRPKERGVLRRPGILAACVAVAAVAAPAASAHARLLDTSPRDRKVLVHAPKEVRLRFDEPVRVLGGMKAVRNFGPSVLAGKPHAQGRDIVLPLEKIGDGDYSVLWRVLSDDGHVETGVLAFAVGAGRAPPVPSLVAAGTVTVRDVVSRIVLFAGLLLVAGVAAFRLLVWRIVAPRGTRPPHELALLLGGFVAVFAGASGLTGHGLPFTRFGVAYGALIALAVCGAVATAISAADPPVRGLGLVIALAIVPLPSIAGHALEDGRLRAPELGLDVVHVLAASVWLGGVASLLLSLRALEGERRIALARRFSAVALGAVLLLGASGVGRALGELRAFHQLWTTSYGLAILVKSGIFGALVVVGAINRRWLLARAGGGLERALRAELVLLLGAVCAVGFLTDARPGRTIVPAARVEAGPVRLPPRDAVVFAAQSRDLALGFALRPAGARKELTLTVIGPLGDGVDNLGARIRFPGGAAVGLVPCGSGCYRGLGAFQPGERVTLELTDNGKLRRVPLVLPDVHAPAADALVAAAARHYTALRSVAIDERLSSGLSGVYRTHYQLQAPTSFSYRMANGGAQAVVLGNRRWDRTSAQQPWTESATQPIRQPQIWWESARSAHVVGHTRLGGRPVDVVTLISAPLTAWFEVWIDPQRKLPLALKMIRSAHFMEHRYSGFDAPVRLRPPTG